MCLNQGSYPAMEAAIAQHLEEVWVRGSIMYLDVPRNQHLVSAGWEPQMLHITAIQTIQTIKGPVDGKPHSPIKECLHVVQ